LLLVYLLASNGKKIGVVDRDSDQGSVTFASQYFPENASLIENDESAEGFDFVLIDTP
jgi:cellulose biosynthesis protein BcsQ